MTNEELQPQTTVPQTIPGTTAPAPQGSTTNSIISLVLGILSLLCCGFFTGIPAIILGYSELKAVKEGRIHESNKTLAMIGLILGIAGTVFGLLGAIFYGLMFAFGEGLTAYDQFH